MQTISLNGVWHLCGRPESGGEMLSLCAKVPGCVQLDLSEAGILPKDLYMGENILETERFEGYEWWYEKQFTAPEVRENIYLVFDGVDCLAEYYLNGKKIGESDNMFIRHEFEIGGNLKDGENTLTVHLSSAVIRAHRESYSLGAMQTWGNAPVQTGVRKAPHSFGWDIMPRAVTAGLWRGVSIEIRDEISFSQLFFDTSKPRCTVYYELACKWQDMKNVELEFIGGCGEDSRFYTREKLTLGKAGRLSLRIQNPKLWFPYGYGDANIYDGTANIYSEGKLVHTEPFSFGIRTVVLDRTDTTDGVNGKFRFLINGIEVMCRGSNWVPLDAFHSRDAERYEKALALVKDIGCNILRCWGGNVYEDHTFFDFCDRNGIMVWQDFAMACRSYPKTEKFKRQITEEATAVIRKLRGHPSIILWSGDNEVDEMLTGFGIDPSTNIITREWLPRVVLENDIGRPYLPSSPYFAKDVAHANLPESHLWGPRDYYKSDFYKQSKAHFVSETGYHGCPAMESIKKFITPEKLWPYTDNSEWILHSTDQSGNPNRVMLMEKQIKELFFTVPENPNEYILASQISQAEAKKYFIERIRVARPIKSGIIWWNLLDGWPQMSDAVVDYYFKKKLAYSYIKRSQAPFTIAADELAAWEIRLVACNDTLTEKHGILTVRDALTDEILLTKEFTAKENTSTRIASLKTHYSEQKILIFEWEVDGERGWNHYLCGFPPISFEMYQKFIEKYQLMPKD